jgi:hypothetical protein
MAINRVEHFDEGVKCILFHFLPLWFMVYFVLGKIRPIATTKSEGVIMAFLPNPFLFGD